MQNRTDFLPKHLLAPAQAAYDDLQKPYQPKATSWDLSIGTDDGIVHRPNHGLLHSSRVPAYMPLSLDFFKAHAHETYKMFFEVYADPKRLQMMQIAGFFSVVGREDETGFGTDQTHYLRYRQNSAQKFEEYCKNPKSNLTLTDAEIAHYKSVVLEMGNPNVLEKQKEKMQTIADAFKDGYKVAVRENHLTETQLTDEIASGNIKAQTIIIAGTANNPREIYVINASKEINIIQNVALKTDDIFLKLAAMPASQGTLVLDDTQVLPLKSRLLTILRENSISTNNFDIAYVPSHNPMDHYLLHMAHDLDLFRCFTAAHMQAMMYGPLFKQFCKGYDLNSKEAAPGVHSAITELVGTAIALIKQTGDRLYCHLDTNSSTGGLIDNYAVYNQQVFGPLSHSPEKAIQHINKELNAFQEEQQQRAQAKAALNAQRTQLQAIDADLKLSMPTTSTDIQKCTEQDTALTALIAEYKKLEGKRSSIITNINAPDLDLTTLTTQAQAQRTVLQTVKNQLTALSTTQTALQTQCTTMLQETALDPEKLKTLNEELSKQKTTIQTLEQQNQLATIEAFIKKQQENLIALKDTLNELQELKAKLEIQKAEAKTLELEISNYDTAVAKANGMLAALNQEQQDTTLIFSAIKNNLNLKRPNIAYQVALGVVMAVAVAAVIFGIVLLALLLSPTPLDLPSWIKAIGTIGSIICGAAGFLGIAGTAIGLRLFDSANAAVDQTMTNINQQEQIALQAVSDKIAAQQQLITGLQTTGTTIIQPKQADLAAKKIAIDAFTPKINAIDKEITALLNGQEPKKTTGADDVLGAGTAGTAALLVGFGGGPLGGAGANPPAEPSATPLSGDGTPNLGGTPSPLPMDPM